MIIWSKKWHQYYTAYYRYLLHKTKQKARRGGENRKK